MTKRKRSQGTREPKNPDDKISNLPTDMIREIQSCLPRIDAARTSILSKEWRSIWASHPIIILDEMDFGADYSEYSVTDKAKRVAFLTYLMKFLEIRKRHCEYDCDVDKLFLRLTLEDSPAKELVKKWICFALEKKVKSLFLGLKTIYRNHYYLRGIAFCGTTLVDLTISGCEITNCSFKLPALKFLFLFVVCIEDDYFKNLIAGCPRIQKLLVLDTKKLQTIVVSNPELQFFGVHRPCSDGKIRIESANLDSLEFVSFSMDLCEVEITSTTTVRELTLRNDYDQETLIHFIKKFPLLEKLIIDDCSKLQNLHLSQPNLASLVLMDCIVKDEVRINSPKLKSLEFKGRLTKFEGIEDLQKLEFVQLYLDPVRLSRYWYRWFRDILKSCARSKHLSVICNSQKVIIIPKHVTDILPVNDIKHLELEIISHHGTFEEVIDDFICILPDLKTLSLTLGSSTKFFEFSREDNVLSAKEVHNPKPDKRVSILRSKKLF